jgi:Cu-Zn family superoxide dismutase
MCSIRSIARVSGFLALAACAGQTPEPGTAAETAAAKPVATAELQDSAGKAVGVATLTPADSGGSLSVSVSGLLPGRHGIHIHQNGDCTTPAFTTAGPHFNPGSRQHGLENPDGPHAGDMPNLVVGGDGAADVTLPVSAQVMRQASGAVVIHADPDDQKTDPSGNSGDRLVCGVLRRG